MRRLFPSIVCLPLLACNGEPTPVVIDQPATFAASLTAATVTGSLPTETIAAHDAHQGLMAVVGIVGSSGNVQQFLNYIPETIDEPCWAESVTGNSRTVTYQICGDLVTGSATLEDTTAGNKVLTTATNFSYGGFRLDGALAFRETAAGSVFHEIFPADPAGPAADSVDIVSGTTTVSLDLDGFFTMSTAGGRSSMWGTATATSEGASTSYVFGGETAADVETSAEPSTSLDAPLLDTCRCATSGTLAYTTSLQLDQLDIDLNGSLEGNATTWPTLAAQPGTAHPGTLIVRPGADCGTWTGNFVPDEPITMSGDAVRAAVELACTSNSFNSAEDCERVRQGAASLGDLPVTFSDRVWRETVEALADQAFDNGFCTVPAL
jgi:hypothetical protein